MTAIPAFARRRNRDSSIDSICTRCFQTIATALREEDLLIHEEKHICEPYWDFGSVDFNPDLRTHDVRNLQANIEQPD